MDSLVLHDSPSHYTIEEMQQHPHPPSFHQMRNNPTTSDSPFRRPHSNPNPSVTDQYLYPVFQGGGRSSGNTGNSSYYSSNHHHNHQHYQPSRHSSSSMNMQSVYGEPSNNLVRNHLRTEEDSQQPFLYHNPLHYGSSMEDFSPETTSFNNEKSAFLYPDVTPTRQLGSGSGESGYHGGYHDTNPSSSISSSTSTNPRTPSRHGSSNLFSNSTSRTNGSSGTAGPSLMSTSVPTIINNPTYEEHEVRVENRPSSQIHHR